MVYYTYARGPEHTDATVATGEPATGTHLEVWTADSGGAQITALKTVAGSALPNPYVIVDSFGRYEFRIESQANPVVWIKDPSGKFWQVLASEILPQVPTAVANAAAALAAVSDTTEPINIKRHGVVGDAIAIETTAIQAAMNLSVWPYSKQIFFPTGDYKVDGTLTPPASTVVTGVNWQASRFWPIDGMAVPVFNLGSNGGVTLRAVAIWLGGSTGIPAVVMGGQQQRLEGLDIRQWKGHGVDVSVQNFSTVRNVNVASCLGNGFQVRTTYTLLEGCTSNSNSGHGFVLSNSQYGNASGVLTACLAEFNSGHGFYITGGEWDLQVYGEANTGDLIHVDGTQQYDTSITLASAAALNATSIDVNALTKGLPENAILRFADGTIAIVNADTPGPTIVLKAPLHAAQSSGAVATLAPEDIPPAKLPTVHIRTGTHDGTIYLHACNFSFETGYMPVGGTVTATASARMIGESHVLTHKHNVRTWGGGGSSGLSAALGRVGPTMPVGLAHYAHPNAEYRLAHSAANDPFTDSSVPGAFYLKLTAQFNWAQTLIGWKASSLSLGDYTIRALVRNTAQTANGISFFVYGGPSQTFTTRSAGWEWISLDFTQTEATRLLVTDGIFVQRAGITQVDVAAIVIVPRKTHDVLPGTWLNPTWVDGVGKFAFWVDASGNLRFSAATPTSDTDSDVSFSNGNILQLGSQTKIISGAGTPEGAVTAGVGSLYSRTDGGASTTLYVKQSGSGNTGWVAK